MALRTSRTSTQAIVALGENANETITAFCNAIGVDAPERVHSAREDEVLIWTPGSNEAPRVVRAERATPITQTAHPEIR